jgi:sulfatase modifying factor 1
MKVYHLLFPLLFILFAGCMKKSSKNTKSRFSKNSSSIKNTNHKNMIYIKGGEFEMGADNYQADLDEYPKHKVILSGFWMDITEVTNAQFTEFVKATNYITTSERKIDWEILKKQLPKDTPKPSEDKLQPASLVFFIVENDSDYWWKLVKSANWKHPSGPESNIIGKENFPVVQISWDDAQAYCKWANKRLPTEAEWEYASRGNLTNKIYSWGNENIDVGKLKANSWQGNFPYQNTLKDYFLKSAPVKSFPANGYGLYDMSGNVWEWCSDWYDYNYYKTITTSITNPKGPTKSFDPDDIYASKHTIRGGSFLCNDGYCSGYRNARRMKESPDTGMEHIGFRCVSDK